MTTLPRSLWHLRRGLRPALLASAFLGAALPVAAGAVGTPITAVPFTISTPGRYYLANDLVLPVGGYSAITIAADGVTVDLNGCRLSSAGTATSVFTAGVTTTNHKNITVLNGTLTGFMAGISFGSFSPASRPNRNIVLQDLTITGPDAAGPSTPMGIYVNGGSGVLLKNVSLDSLVGGTAYGAYVQNSDYVRVLETNVGQVAGASVNGIYLNACNYFTVQNCVVDYAGGAGFYSPGSGITITPSCMNGHVMDNRIVTGNLTVNNLYTKYGNNMVETLGGGYLTTGVDAGNNH